MTTGRAALVPAAMVVGAGGALGALVRAGVGELAGTLWGTLIVNVVGASVMGALLVLVTRESLRRFVLTGFLGGFTTVSALAADTAVLAGESAFSAASYFVMTVALGVLGLAGGIRLANLRSAS